MPATLEDAFKNLPKGLRDELLTEYRAAVEAAQGAKWETVGLKAGKLCEIAYSILRGHVDDKFPTKASKPSRMLDACAAFEKVDKAKFGRPVRIQIPRMLIAIYELRNNRAIGHVGGDLDPNEMDGLFFLRGIKWVMAELVRVFHAIDVAEAAGLVEAVTERSVPLIWKKGDRIRVLNPNLSARDKTLLVLYDATDAMTRQELLEAVEYSNLAVFTKTVLRKLHKQALIDFDEKNNAATILPTGTRRVEEDLLSSSVS